MLKTTTAFLRHTLMLGNTPLGQRLIEQYPNTAYAERMKETMAHYPPTPVSFLEFEDTMREINSKRK